MFPKTSTEDVETFGLLADRFGDQAAGDVSPGNTVAAVTV
jgi:hypothetical protein